MRISFLKILFPIFTSLFSILVITNDLIAAPQSSKFEELKAQYLTLRNTDIDLDRAQDWEDLARQFRSYALNNYKTKDAARALQHAALLSEELYGRYRTQDRLEMAAADYVNIIEKYPNSAQAIDALLHLGDLYREAADETKARQYYKQLLIKAPDSELAAIATDKLNQEKRRERLSIGEEQDNKLNERGSDKPLIMIDPGHGGEDFGAVGVGGLLEKDVTLAVAFELEKLLKDRMGALVRLTRRKDHFVPLAERTNLANDFEADLFISIHTNASPAHNLYGTETYVLDNAGDKGAKLLADRENASTRFEGPQSDLQYMLSDLIQNAKMNDSVELGQAVQRSVVRHIDAMYGSARDLGVKRAPFYVLVGAHMPCILIEMSFIDNSLDGKNLSDKEYRKTIAQGIYVGIRRYFDKSRG